ncbi:hypothetical protein RvY_07405 [Ramazzottius varieornatus]|uniref:Uncharacterized protein n=1 Tax=Ramazzottius varieornatus TaxID=947166 RepID=A0A1D1V217_RAMVA|nr:hypothetical protein RvY_07405 [Ramazzottius varieornatus]
MSYKSITVRNSEHGAVPQASEEDHGDSRHQRLQIMYKTKPISLESVNVHVRDLGAYPVISTNDALSRCQMAELAQREEVQFINRSF